MLERPSLKALLTCEFLHFSSLSTFFYLVLHFLNFASFFHFSHVFSFFFVLLKKILIIHFSVFLFPFLFTMFPP